MGEALGTVLPLAVAIAIFPVPIIASVLLVGSERGRAKALIFLLAWSLGLAGVGVIVLLVADGAGASEDGEPTTWTNILVLGLGVVVLALAVKQWLGRPRAGEEAPTPRWMETMDGLTIAKAGALGLGLSALNPKNVLLVAAAAAEIAGFGLAPSDEAAALAVFVVLASVGVAAPLVLSLALGDRSDPLLRQLRGWMARYSAVIMALLFLLIGAKLIGDGLSGLSA